jgi:hypothetical protein
MKESPTPPQARGLLSDNDIRVPKEGELMVIDDQITRTIKGRDHGLVQPGGTSFASFDPRGAGSASPNPPGANSTSSDLEGMSSTSLDPLEVGSDLPDLRGEGSASLESVGPTRVRLLPSTMDVMAQVRGYAPDVIRGMGTL